MFSWCYFYPKATILFSPSTTTLVKPCLAKPFMAASHFLPLNAAFSFNVPIGWLFSFSNRLTMNFSSSVNSYVTFSQDAFVEKTTLLE